MAERYGELTEFLKETEENTSKRLGAIYDRLAEEAVNKDENDGGLITEAKAEAEELKKASGVFFHLFQRTSSEADELEVRIKDTVKSKKKRRFLPPPTTNAVIDYQEKKEGHFASGINFYKLFLICFIGSFAGVVIELLWCLITNGYIESRSGLVYGPFNLLYGVGAVCFSLVLYRFRNRSWLLSFFGSFLIGSVVEYACSFFQELVLGTKSWDYSKLPFNLNGRICLLYSVFWGLLGIFWIKNLYPFISKWILRIPNRFGKVLTWLLAAFIVFDSAVSLCSTLRWSERTRGEEPHGDYEQFLDEHFPDERMGKVYSNMEFGKTGIDS